jgi:nucleoside-diphosphate-sugar epimerase
MIGVCPEAPGRLRMSVHKKPVLAITGSSGLIGTSLVRNLERDFEVVGLDLKPPDTEGPADFIECDLTSDDSARDALAELARRHGRKLASVVHLAAYYDFSGEPSPLYRTLTVEGTRRLLRGLRELESVEQLVFTSTVLVMKPAEKGELLDESSPVQAEWDYPQSKVEAEQVIREEHGDIPAVILRMAGVYDEDCRSIPLAQQIRRIYEKDFKSYFFPGNADHGQSFLHLDDAVECIRAVIERRAELDPLEVFLAGEPEVLSYAELQDRLGEAIHGKQWPTIRIPAPLAKVGAWLEEKLPGHESFIKPWMIDLADAHYPVSIERARTRLGWRPKRRLSTTLDAMVERLKQDPERWYRENGLEPPEEVASRDASKGRARS